MEGTQPEPRLWKHILALMLWLLLMPPVGLWKLWQDKRLSTAGKWRALVYLGLLPFLAYATLQIYLASQTFMRLAP